MIPKLEIITDRDGNFTFAVPNADAIVGVSGKVKGFCSIPDIHLYRDQVQDFAGDVLDRLMTELKKDELTDLAPIEFRLNPCLDIDVTVVDDTGQPVPNAVLAWSKLTNLNLNLQGSGVSYSHGNNSFSGQTDAKGQVKIKQLYDDDFFIAAAQSKSKKSKGSLNRLVPII